MPLLQAAGLHGPAPSSPSLWPLIEPLVIKLIKRWRSRRVYAWLPEQPPPKPQPRTQPTQ